MCPCRIAIRRTSLLCCLLCLLCTPFLTAGATARQPLGTRHAHPKICVEALGRFKACLPGALFTARETTASAAATRGGRRLFRTSRAGCDSARKITSRERRRRLISSLIGTEIPDLGVSYNGLKLGLDIDTDLTGIEYNGIRLDYSVCW